jgi:hypothetical protein
MTPGDWLLQVFDAQYALLASDNPREWMQSEIPLAWLNGSRQMISLKDDHVARFCGLCLCRQVL